MPSAGDTNGQTNGVHTHKVLEAKLEPRKLVLCFDGTGDSFDLDNSNVVQLFSVLTKGERRRQLCYYQVRLLLVF